MRRNIFVRNVSKRYRKGAQIIIALNNVTIEIENCKLTLLYGPVGSGKTTLLNIIAGLEEPDEGEVWVANNPFHLMSKVRRAHVRRKFIAYAPQIPIALPHLTVRDNILFAARLRGLNPTPGQVEQLLEDLGIKELSDRKASQLSGGQLRLLMLAMALIHRRPILLLDEPTAFLDNSTARRIWKLVSDLSRGECITVLAASHDEHAKAYADKVYIMRNGVIVEQKP